MDFHRFLFGIIICFLLSFCVGLERQVRRRFIGLRTMILVAVGSYIFVSFSFLVTGETTDVTRIASQIVAGMGFLGAGVIIKDSEKGKIRGLTTAATLWCDAGIGILCAGGFIYEAIIASCVVLFSNIILRHINSIVNNRAEEKNIYELFLITLTNVKTVSECTLKFHKLIEKYDTISLENYIVNKDDIEIKISISKYQSSKINEIINNIIKEFNINSYKLEKLSEVKREETDDEL